MAGAVEVEAVIAQPGCAGRNSRTVRSRRRSVPDTPREDRPRETCALDETAPCASGTIGKWVRSRRQDAIIRRA
jgi:hypothetical protein